MHEQNVQKAQEKARGTRSEESTGERKKKRGVKEERGWSATTALRPQLCQIASSHSVSSLYETLGRPWNWFNMSSVTIINTTIPHMHTHTAHTIAKLENVVPGKKQSSRWRRDEVTALGNKSTTKGGLSVRGGSNGSQNPKIWSYRCFVSPNGLFFGAPEWRM